MNRLHLSLVLGLCIAGCKTSQPVAGSDVKSLTDNSLILGLVQVNPDGSLVANGQFAKSKNYEFLVCRYKSGAYTSNDLKNNDVCRLPFVTDSGEKAVFPYDEVTVANSTARWLRIKGYVKGTTATAGTVVVGIVAGAAVGGIGTAAVATSAGSTQGAGVVGTLFVTDLAAISGAAGGGVAGGSAGGAVASLAPGKWIWGHQNRAAASALNAAFHGDINAASPTVIDSIPAAMEHIASVLGWHVSPGATSFGS